MARADCPTPRTYFVVSDEVWEVEPILDDGTGPMVPVRYVDEVQATSKKEAIRVAYSHADSDLRIWAAKNRADGRHPFSGLTVEHPHCEHGVCLDLDSDGDPTQVCKPCADEFFDRV